MQNNIHIPNLFLLGSAKSGTTSLYHYLKQHKEIYFPDVKEPSFFSEGFQVIANPIEYYGLYDAVNEESVIGDASHVYMTNPSTARVLKGLFPSAKFLVILRNPVDRAYSLYNHMRRHGFEQVGTFEGALEIEDSRFLSVEFKNHCPQYLYNFLYYRSGLYGEQLARYFSLFPKEQFHITTLSNLIDNTADCLRSVYDFLGVSDELPSSLAPQNVGGLHESMNPNTRNMLYKCYLDDLRVLYEITSIEFPKYFDY